MIEFTWLGHSSWLVRSASLRIAIDPFLTDNPKAACKPEDVEADIVLISHGHFDHVQDAASIANRCDSLLIANFEIATWFAEKHGVKRTMGMNLGGWGCIPGARIKMTVAHHSSQLPDGTYGGNPGGYVVELPAGKFYYAGDTALFSDMQLIASLGIDVAIVPIGDLFTMGIDDSVQAVRWIKPNVVLPTHYNTWPPIEQDAMKWRDRVRNETDTAAVVLQPGETFRLAPKPLEE